MVKKSIQVNSQINANDLTATAANPAQAAAAQSEHDPSAPLCLTPTPTQHPKTTHAIPPHTSQALEHRTAQQPNMHRPASSKLSFEP
ncbi:unannotated protein [freshwater metagenome]|uniref:Unannotated protein n=1 Tax=freshwater metagenome TaxID=449393 RepID=A0A6J6WP44_9ZZZZ